MKSLNEISFVRSLSTLKGLKKRLGSLSMVWLEVSTHHSGDFEFNAEVTFIEKNCALCL